jgi:AcrR family transcriptional regulator
MAGAKAAGNREREGGPGTGGPVVPGSVVPGSAVAGSAVAGSAVAGSAVAGSAVAGSAVPGPVAAAWGVRERPQRGPKPVLSLGRIVDAAVRVADADGLEAVSMGRVARELGAAPMSLYRHVPGKEELLHLMVDAAWGDPPDAPAAGEHWRAGLARWAWALRAAGRRHPWVVRIPLNGLPIMPHEVAWFENALACLGGTGLAEARKASVAMLLGGYVRNMTATDADIGAAIAASGLSPSEWIASYPRLLKDLADPHRFPALTVLLASGTFDVADDPDDEFTFGLDRILDGVGALIGGD